MKRKQLLTKVLLAVALLGGSVSAWAQTSLYERGTTNAWSDADVAEGKWSAGTIGTSGLEVTNGVASSLTIAPTSDTSILTWTATWNPGNATGTANNTNAYIQFGDVKFAFYGSSWFTKVTIGSTTTQLSGGGATRSRDYVITVTINQKTNEVSYTFNDNGTEIKGTGTTASAGSFTTLTHGLGGKAPNWTNTATLKKVEVTEKENTAATANYTVRYMCGETVVKDAVVRSGEVGAGITLQSTDTETLYNGDESIKYVYSSDNASEATIASDGSTVVTVNYVAKAKITYTVNAVLADESVLGEIASVGGYEGETLSVFWSKYVKFSDKWYVADAPFYQGEITASGVKNVIYAESDIDYFIECENMNGVRTDRWVLETSENNSGYRKIRINNYYTTIYTATFEEGGVYSLALPYNNSNSTNHTYQVKIKNGNEYTTVAEWTISNGSNTYTLDNVVIPAGCALAISCDGISGNSNARMDYLTLKKISTVPTTITSAGWATLYTPYALDFSGVAGLTAYTAVVADNKVTLTEVTDVPAGTGVVLKGAADTYDIPVAASSATAKGDLLGSATDATAYNAIDGYTLYMLKKVDEKAQFVPVTSGSIAAGKAYLKIATAEARNLDVTFADEATGIESVKSEEIKVKSEVYNLKGQRVSEPTKGLYIVNGKKIAIK